MISAIIVEDEMNILRYMQKVLESFHVFQIKGTFSDSEKALASFSDINPDCVFLDIEMPRMNGIELARELLEIKKNLNIVFTTAYSQYAVNAFEIDAIDYLLKPVLHKDILRIIKRIEKRKGEQLMEDHILKTPTDVPVRCLGGFDVRDINGELVNWPTQKAEELFAYFICYQGEPISKWRLINLLWPDMNEKKGLHNLYNTIYRVRLVIKNLPFTPLIRKLNDGYVLESPEPLSDLKRLSLLEGLKLDGKNITFASMFFFDYHSPLYGTRDYLWSLPIEEQATQVFGKVCTHLLNYHRANNDLPSAEKVVKHYALQHLEDEDMMQSWLEVLKDWDLEEAAIEYKNWFNTLLNEADLPMLS